MKYLEINLLSMNPTQHPVVHSDVKVSRFITTYAAFKVRQGDFMITLGKLIAAGSTSKVKVRITDGEIDYNVNTVLFKVQALDCAQSWVDVAPPQELEVSGTEIEILLTPEQTAIVPNTTTRRRLIVQAFYDEGNGVTLNNTNAVYFDISDLPSLTEEIAPVIGNLEIKSQTEKVETSIGTSNIQVTFNQPLVSFNLTATGDIDIETGIPVEIPVIWYTIDSRNYILEWATLSAPIDLHVTATSVYEKELQTDITIGA